MNTPLEILHAPAKKPRRAPPVLFLHGAYAGAWCWEDFLSTCANSGFDAYALSFRGHAGSAGRDQLDAFGIDDFVADLATATKGLKSPPIIVAHSMGGYMAQRFLARGGQAAGIALLASVAPYGLGFSAWYMGVANPKLLFELNRFQQGVSAPPDLAMLRDLLFSAGMPESELARFAQLAQHESQGALNEMLVPRPWQLWDLPRLPALVLAAGEDKIIPACDTWATAQAFGVTPEFLPGRGHALMLDQGREEVQQRLLRWLEQISR